jgi:glucokinase
LIGESQLNRDELPVIALDVGGSLVKSGLVVADQQIVGNVCVDAIQSESTADVILNTLAAIITVHLDKVKEVSGVAFAFPGPFDYEQGICLIQNQAKYDALFGLNVGVELKKILGTPMLEMKFRNDAEAAILGEALYGAGKSYSRLLGLTLGTGLGSAFIGEGRLVAEGDDVPSNGWLYSLPFGHRRADDVFSTRGLLGRLRERGIHADNILSGIQSAGDNSTALSESFASFGKDLGEFLEPFISDFRAEALLITGGIAEAWECFAPSLKRSLSVPVLRGALGNEAALLGAAVLYL